MGTQADTEHRPSSAGQILRARLAAAPDRGEDVRDPKAVSFLDSLVLVRVRERHGRDTGVHEVVQVDPREAFREDELDAEKHGGDRRVLAGRALAVVVPRDDEPDRKSTRLNSSHLVISYAVFCLKK